MRTGEPEPRGELWGVQGWNDAKRVIDATKSRPVPAESLFTPSRRPIRACTIVTITSSYSYITRRCIPMPLSPIVILFLC